MEKQELPSNPRAVMVGFFCPANMVVSLKVAKEMAAAKALPRCARPGAQNLPREAYLGVRRSDEGEAQRRRWTFYKAIKYDSESLRDGDLLPQEGMPWE
jgi:hypothetical protein